MVMSQTLYRLLRQARPEHAIDVVAPPWSVPLLEAMPEVDRAISLAVGHGELGLRRRYRLGRSLRANHYEQAYVLPNSFKSALLPWFATIPQRTGFLGEHRWGLLNDIRHLDPRALPQLAQRYAALAAPATTAACAPLLQPRLQIKAEWTPQLPEGFAAAPVLALCPGAEFGSAKRWPVTSYADLANRYLAQGWGLILLGSKSDARITAQIKARIPQSRLGNTLDLAGETTLQQALGWLSRCDAVVTNDSGLMHVAAALGRPQVAIFGPTATQFTPPLNPRAHILSSDLECAPCAERECPLGHHHCMQLQTVDSVDRALQQVLQQGAHGHLEQ